VSGGSFDYLCFSDDISEALAKPEALAGMAKALQVAAPDHPVTVWTTALAQLTNQPTPGLPEPVAKVWHAMEWWYSADSSQDSARAVLAQYADADLPAPRL